MGGYLPVNGSERMTWKYDNCSCGCGLVETEMHVFLNALYMKKKENDGEWL